MRKDDDHRSNWAQCKSWCKSYRRKWCSSVYSKSEQTRSVSCCMKEGRYVYNILGWNRLLERRTCI